MILSLCCNSVLTRSHRLSTSVFLELRFRRILTSIDTCLGRQRFMFLLATTSAHSTFAEPGISSNTYSRLLHHASIVVTPYWQVRRRSRLTSFKEYSVLLPASLPVPTSSTGVCRGCCTPSCTGSTYLSESHKLGVRFGCQHGRAPQYLTDYCLPVSDVASRQHLRSTSRRLLVVPRHRLSTYGRRAFAVAGPTAWNSLPDNLRNPDVTTDKRLVTSFFLAYLCN